MVKGGLKMRVQVSKTLTVWLNNQFKQHNIPYKAVYTTMTQREYDWQVGDTSMDTLEYDYNFTTGKYRVIKILYPDDYYACPQYLTTRQLIHLAQNINRSEEKFFNNIRQEIEI